MPSLSLFFYSSTPCLVLLYFKVYYHYVTGVIFFIIIVIITIIHFNLALLWSLRNLPVPVIFSDVPWKPKEGSLGTFRQIQLHEGFGGPETFLSTSATAWALHCDET